MSESKLILQALNDFINALNKFDKNEIITTAKPLLYTVEIS